MNTAQNTLFDFSPTPAKSSRSTPRQPQLITNHCKPKGDLFGDVPEVRFSVRYFSGSTAKNDAAGIMASGLALGITATEVKNHIPIGQARDYLRKGGRVFIDSGVFGNYMSRMDAVQTGKPIPGKVSFEDVINVYEQVIENMSVTDLAGLALVMPDEINAQAETLALLRQHRTLIRRYIDLGIDVIVPVQKGAMPVQWALHETVVILGTGNFRAGVPSKAAAMSDAEVRSLRHHRFHLLGRAAEGLPLRRRGYALVEANPGADLSCDANMLRPFYADIAVEQQARREQLGSEIAFTQVMDDTELIFAVLHDRAWMSKAEVTAIAEAIAPYFGAQSAGEWIKAHQAAPLATFINERYGEEQCDLMTDRLYHDGLPGIFHLRATARISQATRVGQVRDYALRVASRFGEMAQG